MIKITSNKKERKKEKTNLHHSHVFHSHCVKRSDPFSSLPLGYISHQFHYLSVHWLMTRLCCSRINVLGPFSRVLAGSTSLSIKKITHTQTLKHTAYTISMCPFSSFLNNINLPLHYDDLFQNLLRMLYKMFFLTIVNTLIMLNSTRVYLYMSASFNGKCLVTLLSSFSHVQCLQVVVCSSFFSESTEIRTDAGLCCSCLASVLIQPEHLLLCLGHHGMPGGLNWLAGQGKDTCKTANH